MDFGPGRDLPKIQPQDRDLVQQLESLVFNKEMNGFWPRSKTWKSSPKTERDLVQQPKSAVFYKEVNKEMNGFRPRSKTWKSGPKTEI